MRSSFTRGLRPCTWTILYRMWTVPRVRFRTQARPEWILKPIQNEKPVAVGAANYLL